MSQEDVPEVPQDVWCLRLTLDPQALDAPAILWTVLAEDPKPRFVADVRRLDELRKGRPDATDGSTAGGRLRAAWDRLFRQVRGDNVHPLTPAPRQHALTTNELGGHKWLATEAFHSASGEYCWCIPFTAVHGQAVEVTLDTGNRVSLADLAGRHGLHT